MRPTGSGGQLRSTPALCTAAVVAALALFGCHRHHAPKAEAGPAGIVVSISGRVTASRAASGAAPRRLHKGDPVWADDTVATAAGASVTIHITHNGALWNLGGGRRERVDASPAWKASGSGDSAGLAQAAPATTVAAGRQAEKTAADTRTTAPPAAELASPAAEPPPPAGAPATAAAVPRRAASTGHRRGRAAPAAHEHEHEHAHARPPRRRRHQAAKRPRVRTPSPPKSAAVSNALAAQSGAQAAKSGEEAQTLVTNGVRAAVKRCFARDHRHHANLGGKLTVSVRVRESGKVSSVRTKVVLGDLGRVPSCIARRLRSTSFATGGHSVNLQLTMPLY